MGRDIYIREGCVGCHSQMIRPFRSETERYGEYSKVGEYIYDHPFLWGSKRTGPDLHREGGKYSDAWHFNHMESPRSMSPGSIMPAYPWLLTQTIDTNAMPSRIKALRKTGVPYPAGYENGDAQKELAAQANTVLINLAVGSITNAKPNSEILALTAYLQRLGTDIKKAAPVAAGILPAVEPGILPGGKTSAKTGATQTPGASDTSNANSDGKMPSSTAGGTPAATTTALNN
jgi:cytochrome c oxidase cbb3-type subunit I/II